jgi:hypothetical protein
VCLRILNRRLVVNIYTQKVCSVDSFVSIVTYLVLQSTSELLSLCPPLCPSKRRRRRKRRQQGCTCCPCND